MLLVGPVPNEWRDDPMADWRVFSFLPPGAASEMTGARKAAAALQESARRHALLRVRRRETCPGNLMPELLCPGPTAFFSAASSFESEAVSRACRSSAIFQEPHSPTSRWRRRVFMLTKKLSNCCDAAKEIV